MSLSQLPPSPIPAVGESHFWNLLGLGPDGQALPTTDGLSLYALTLRSLRKQGRLKAFPGREGYGKGAAAQHREIARQLCSLWLHRLLLLQELQHKLLAMHDGQEAYAFLTEEQFPDWQALDSFLCQDLAQLPEARSQARSLIPRLDLPLFSLHPLEQQLLRMGELNNNKEEEKRLLPQLLASLSQSGSLLTSYRLPDTPPPDQAFQLLRAATEGWSQERWQQARICDPLARDGALLQAAGQVYLQRALEQGWLGADRLLKGWQLLPQRGGLQLSHARKGVLTYRASAGPGGYKRQIEKQSQQRFERLFEALRAFYAERIFAVSSDPIHRGRIYLQLWAGLLRWAPYTEASGFEQFPDFPDFSYQLLLGNPLKSHFQLRTELGKLLQGNTLRLGLYRSALALYRRAQDPESRQEARGIFEDMHQSFQAQLQRSHPDYQRLNRLEKTLNLKSSPLFELEREPEEEARHQLRQQQLKARIELLKARLLGQLPQEEAFEWRYRFPEVLDPGTGRFLGFDLILMVPPEGETEEGGALMFAALRLGLRLIREAEGRMGLLLPDDFFHNKSFRNALKCLEQGGRIREKTLQDGEAYGPLITGKYSLILDKE